MEYIHYNDYLHGNVQHLEELHVKPENTALLYLVKLFTL